MSYDSVWEERYRYLEASIEQIFIGISGRRDQSKNHSNSEIKMEVRRESDDSEYLVCIVNNGSLLYEFNLVTDNQLVLVQRGWRNAVRLAERVDRVIINLFEDQKALEPLATKEVNINE